MCGTLLFVYVLLIQGVSLCSGRNALVLQFPVGQECLWFVRAADVLGSARQTAHVSMERGGSALTAPIPAPPPQPCPPAALRTEKGQGVSSAATLKCHFMRNTLGPGGGLGNGLQDSLFWFEQNPSFLCQPLPSKESPFLGSELRVSAGS